jgi:hypothetical protein
MGGGIELWVQIGAKASSWGTGDRATRCGSQGPGTRLGKRWLTGKENLSKGQVIP